MNNGEAQCGSVCKVPGGKSQSWESVREQSFGQHTGGFVLRQDTLSVGGMLMEMFLFYWTPPAWLGIARDIELTLKVYRIGRQFRKKCTSSYERRQRT